MPELKLSPLTHAFSLALAVLIAAFTFMATTATAATGASYRAELATPAKASKFVVRDVVWKCTDASCIAPQSGSRPAIVCASLARKVGPLTAFLVEGVAVTADELARCNGRK